MPRTTATRKKLFRVALANAGMTARQWCEKQGISNGHLSNVLAGDRESRTLVEKVDLFIDKQLISISAITMVA